MISSSMKKSDKSRERQLSNRTDPDFIAESIKIEESYGHSSKKSAKLGDSSGKASRSSKLHSSLKKSDRIEEDAQEDDSLERDEGEDYSEDFYQSSARNKASSFKSQHKPSEIEESGAYTETFEDPSASRHMQDELSDFEED